jgi:hypothetical protein
MPLALSDDQLRIVMAAAASLPVEERDAFLKRLADTLRHGFTDAELDAAMREALALVQEPA